MTSKYLVGLSEVIFVCANNFLMHFITYSKLKTEFKTLSILKLYFEVIYLKFLLSPLKITELISIANEMHESVNVH